MKRFTFRGEGRLLYGYTIIEVLIFLAVSGALLISAANLISGRQEKVRFSQAVVSLEQQFQDTFNDVSTGYFPSNSDFSCSNSGGAVQVVSGSAAQGTNEGCVFAGKLLHFYANSPTNTEYRIYTIVGLRSSTSPTSGPLQLLGNTLSPPKPGIVEDKFTEDDLSLQRFTGGGYAIQDTGTPGNRYHSLAIISDFGTQSGPNNSVSGNAARVKLYGYRAWNGNGAINTNATNLVPIKGDAVICLSQNGFGGREAALVITPQLTIERQIDSQPGICP